MSPGFAHLLHPDTDAELLADERLSWLAQFAHVLGIRPWEFDRVTVPEFRQLVTALKDYNREGEE